MTTVDIHPLKQYNYNCNKAVTYYIKLESLMNIKDVAALAETSVATVSRVINCEENVSAETRKRVLEVIESTGYKPNLVGRALRSQRSGKILIMLPSIANPFYSRVVQGVEHLATANGYDTLACITHRDPDCELHYLDLVRTKQVDGVIGFTTSLSYDKLSQFAAKYPYVQCCARTSGVNVTYTGIDDVAAAADAINYFVKTGHTRIAFVSGMYGRHYEQDRETGYRQALEINKIPFRPEYLISSDYDFRDGIDACQKLMELPDPPTAIFACSDQIAAGVIKYLLKIGKQPGQDVDVIGFDGTFIADMYAPSISTVKQPGYELGKTAFNLLQEIIADPRAVTKRVIMNHSLILNETTRPLPGAAQP